MKCFTYFKTTDKKIKTFEKSNEVNAMNIQGKKSPVNRREFCKSVPCATFGVLASSSLLEAASTKDSAKPSPERSLPNNGNLRAEEITAVTAKVISQEGTCGLGHKVGDIVKCTESGVEGKICIHALYSMLPKIFAMMHEAHFPWLDNPDVATHACPDAYNPVVFEVKRIREK